METLACMSPRACPSCWHFRSGGCALLTDLHRVMDESPSLPGSMRLPLLASA